MYLSDEENARNQLDSILASADFDASERNRAFLRFIVDEALCERGERIKAYTIATSVFGRSPEFDPQTDPIVRIEARRLRRSLERYYLMAGRSDALIITIPTGGYVPSFSQRDLAASLSLLAPQPVPRRPARATPSILVRAFEADDDRPEVLHLATRFTRQVLIGLTRFTVLDVYSKYAAARSADRDERDTPPAERRIEYVLSGALSVDGNRFRTDTVLTEEATGRCLWAESYDRVARADEFGEVRDDIADAIVRAVAQPHGVVFGRLIRQAEAKRPEKRGATDFVALFHKYWQVYDCEMHEQIRAGLERAIVDDSDDCEALVALSLVLSDAFRLGYDQARYGFDARARAMALAGRAIDIAPRSSAAYLALALAYRVLDDPAASLEALNTGRTLNPNDTAIMAEHGFRLALAMDWEHAVPLLERSFIHNPGQPTSYRTALALYHYMHGRYELALTEARRVNTPGTPYGLIMVAIAAARLGRTAEAKCAVAGILAQQPDCGERIEVDLARRQANPGLIASVLDGMRLAGLPASTATGRSEGRVD